VGEVLAAVTDVKKDETCSLDLRPAAWTCSRPAAHFKPETCSRLKKF